MITLNIGQIDRLRCPQFVFETREPADIELFSNALPKLVGVGLPIKKSWALEKLSIPEPEDGDELLTVPQPDMELPPELRPVKPNPTTPQRTAATRMRYVAVMTNERGEVIYPDQHTLDQTIDALPADAMTEAVQKAVAPVIAALRAGTTPDEAFEQLLAAQPQMDESAIAELLARCIFVADVWGRLNAG
jgi:phage gp29-like protein